MQSREHEVARQRGLDASAGGLLVAHLADHDDVRVGAQERPHHDREIEAGLFVDLDLAQAQKGRPRFRGDRKSTRLNSSHSQISYAVFCLKKKKKTKQSTQSRGNSTHT